MVVTTRVFLCGQCTYLGAMSDGWHVPNNMYYSCGANGVVTFPRLIETWREPRETEGGN
jgi:hypothetical protein